MRVNIEFLVVAYFVSMFVDWIFQWQWQAWNKSKWGKNDDKGLSLLAVLSHSYVYAVFTLIGLVFLNVIPIEKQVLVLYVLFFSHLIIDTRIPVKWIMRFKGISWNDINNNKDLSYLHIGIDHRLHEMVLLILALFI